MAPKSNQCLTPLKTLLFKSVLTENSGLDFHNLACCNLEGGGGLSRPQFANRFANSPKKHPLMAKISTKV